MRLIIIVIIKKKINQFGSMNSDNTPSNLNVISMGLRIAKTANDPKFRAIDMGVMRLLANLIFICLTI